MAPQRAAAGATKARKPKRLSEGSELRQYVERLVRDFHSPTQIAGILKRINSAETTHQVNLHGHLYDASWGSLRTDLLACLRQSRKSRRPRARGVDCRGAIPNMVGMHHRPVEIAERLIPGHWEGALIKGARNASGVGTLVERTSHFVTLAKMDNASADSVRQGFAHILNRIAVQKRRSLTYDQGKEMAGHEKLSEDTGLKVYFADPHSPWQGGINENTNGLLGQYLPKGTRPLWVHPSRPQ